MFDLDVRSDDSTAIPRARPIVGTARVDSPWPAEGMSRESTEPGTVQAAGFGDRLIAMIIDLAIVEVTSPVIAGLLVSFLPGSGSVSGMMLTWVGAWIVQGIVILLYAVGMEASAWQATLGKRAVGLKVVDRHGRQLGVGQALGRNAAKSLSTLTLGLGYLTPLWRADKTTIHDRASGSRVIKSRPAVPS